MPIPHNFRLRELCYDLEVQAIVKNIMSASLFSLIRYLITSAFCHKYSPIPGAISDGICATNAELGVLTGNVKHQVEHAMRLLKENALIVMDFANSEMGRTPVYFLGQRVKTLQLRPEHIRLYDLEVYMRLKCINAAVVHKHINYWNKVKSEPLTQSFNLMSNLLGLTRPQLELAIEKLKCEKFLETSMNSRRFYQFVAVVPGLNAVDNTITESGSVQSIGEYRTKIGRVQEGQPESAGPNTPHIDYKDYEDKKRRKEDPPPFFSQDSKAESDEPGYAIRGKLVVLNPAAKAYLLSLANGNEHKAHLGEIRFIQDVERLGRSYSRNVQADLSRCMTFAMQNLGSALCQEDTEKAQLEQREKEEKARLVLQEHQKKISEQQKAEKRIRDIDDFLRAQNIDGWEALSTLGREALHCNLTNLRKAIRSAEKKEMSVYNHMRDHYNAKKDLSDEEKQFIAKVVDREKDLPHKQP